MAPAGVGSRGDRRELQRRVAGHDRRAQRPAEAGRAQHRHLGRLSHAAAPRSAPARPRWQSRSSATSASVSVRSGAWKRSRRASERLPSPACSPRVDVEDLGRGEQLAAALAHRGAHLGGAHVGRHHHGDVLQHRREARDVPEGRAPLRPPRPARPASSSKAAAPVEVPGPRHERVQLADPAHLAAAHGHGGRPPRMQEGPGRRAPPRRSSRAAAASASTSPFAA